MQEQMLLIEACRLADDIVNRMCRLASLSIHALNTLGVISQALQSDDMRQIDSAVLWSRFVDIDFYTFVCSADAHAAVKEMVRSVCYQTVLWHNGVQVGDRFVEKLLTFCYLYYSTSDKLSYDAIKLLSKLDGASSKGSDDIKDLVDQCVAMLLQQSLYWDNAEDVLGAATLISSTSNRANNLWYCCDKLRVYGSTLRVSPNMSSSPSVYYQKVVDAIVDMCLIACNHFYGCIIPNSAPHYTMSKMLTGASSMFYGTNNTATTLLLLDSVARYDQLERSFYRGGAVSKLTDVEIISAKEACYACLWYNIQAIKTLPESLFGTGPITAGTTTSGASSSSGAVYTVRNELVKNPKLAYNLVLHMIARICASSDDVLLHKFIYSQLYTDNEREILTELQSNPFLDDFLRQIDPILLYKYVLFCNIMLLLLVWV